MKKAKKTILARQVFNEDGVDVSPRPLAHWSTDTPIEEFEHMFTDMSPDAKHKRKYLGSRHRTKSSASSSTFAEIENNVTNQRWYFENKLWVPPEPFTTKVTVVLNEEGPFWLLDLTDFVVPKESEEYSAVETRNKNYLTLLENKFGSEKYIDRGSNTIHSTRKTKILQTDEVGLENASTQVSPHNFFESEKLLGYHVHLSKACELHLSNTLSGITFLDHTKVTDEELLNNSNILEACVYVERILQLNQYYLLYAKYRNESLISEEMEDNRALETPDSLKRPLMTSRTRSNINLVFKNLSLRPLWIFKSVLTAGLSVSSINFNPTNNDVLAAGYFRSEQLMQQQNGFVGCWSIKNIEYPERHFKTDSGVTVVAFSEINPFMLAVGFLNGGLSFYNVSTSTPSLLFSSMSMALGHKNPVSALKWINKNGYEVLITTSTDGRVLQWSFLNGLQCKEILRLKSMPSKSEIVKGQHSSGEYDGGLCFDFSSDQSEIYLIGTDSGYIHKCSTIHANQYFKTYSGHIAPIYKVKWSPRNYDMFASCSADTTVKIWHQEGSKALHDLLPMNPPNSSAFDIAWCPNWDGILMCLFGTELQVWDLLANKLDPIFIYRTEDSEAGSFTCLNFTNKSVFFGNTTGEIMVHQMAESTFLKEHKDKDLLSQ